MAHELEVWLFAACVQTRKRILGMAQALPRAARTLQAAPMFAGEPLIEQIATLIEQRSALTTRRFTEEGDDSA